MPTFQRSQVDTLVRRLNERPTFMIFVVGPRHSGKTTIVRQALQTIDRPCDFFDVPNDVDLQRSRLSYPDSACQIPRRSDLIWLANAWRKARAQADTQPNGSILVFDEIQEIPYWSSVVKGLWDSDRYENRRLHVVLLCSSPMRIQYQSNLTESMAGRFQPLEVRHWSFSEMANAFGYDLDEYFYFGGYPGAAKFIHDEKLWRDYVIDSDKSAVEKDILAMTRVDKPELFKRLIAMGIRSSGEILPLANTLKLPPQYGDIPKLSSDLDLLSNVNLLASFRRYDPSHPWLLETLPKLNVLNTASFTATSEYTFEQARSDSSFWEQVVESAIGAHILNTASSYVRPYYWYVRRKRSKLNAWFVLHRGPLIVGIRRQGASQNERERGSTAFAETIKPDRLILIGEGGIQLSDFLSTPVDKWIDDE